MNIRPLVVQREGTRIYLEVKFSVTGPKVRDIWEKKKKTSTPEEQSEAVPKVSILQYFIFELRLVNQLPVFKDRN